MKYADPSDSHRKYSEIKAERRATDPELIRRSRIMDEIVRLEAEASVACHPAERERIQCEAEELRCGLYHLPR